MRAGTDAEQVSGRGWQGALLHACRQLVWAPQDADGQRLASPAIGPSSANRLTFSNPAYTLHPRRVLAAKLQHLVSMAAADSGGEAARQQVEAAAAAREARRLALAAEHHRWGGCGVCVCVCFLGGGGAVMVAVVVGQVWWLCMEARGGGV